MSAIGSRCFAISRDGATIPVCGDAVCQIPGGAIKIEEEYAAAGT